MFQHLLSVMIFLPILAGLLLLMAPVSKKSARIIGFGVSLAVLVLSFDVYTAFQATGVLEEVEIMRWIPSLGIAYHVGVDGISLFIVMACAVLLPIVYVLFKTQAKGYYANLLIVQGAMLGALCAADIILFYVFWEIMLLPIFFMLGLYGGQKRIAATLKITLYTIAGSLFMLASLIYIATQYHAQTGVWSFAMSDIAMLDLSGQSAAIALFGLMIAFAIKIPLFPFHTWLPDAYTEAPSAATFVLSAIMAKIGVYGVIRLAVPVFEPEFARYAILFAYSGLIGMLYCGIAAIAQKDCKRLVAFSSASHMGIIAVGVFSMNVQALTGTVYQIVAHATSTGALFLLLGLMEERMQTRKISELGGIAAKAPLFALFFAIVLLASVGLPGTSGFVGEFFIILGALKFNILVGVLAGTAVIVGVCYMLWMFQRVFFEKSNAKTEQFRDLTPAEGFALLPIIVLILLMGIYPHPFLQKIEPSTARQFAVAKTVVAQGSSQTTALPSEFTTEKN